MKHGGSLAESRRVIHGLLRLMKNQTRKRDDGPRGRWLLYMKVCSAVGC